MNEPIRTLTLILGVMLLLVGVGGISRGESVLLLSSQYLNPYEGHIDSLYDGSDVISNDSITIHVKVADGRTLPAGAYTVATSNGLVMHVAIDTNGLITINGNATNQTSCDVPFAYAQAPAVISADVTATGPGPTSYTPRTWHYDITTQTKSNESIWGIPFTDYIRPVTDHIATVNLDGTWCRTCPTCPSCGGMARLTIDRFLGIFSVSDAPEGYNPPRGEGVNFQITYGSVDKAQPNPIPYFNTGTNWNNNWESYIRGGPMDSEVQAYRYVPGGGEERYGNYDPNAQAFAPESRSQAVLSWTTGPNTYQLKRPDGSVEIYNVPDNPTNPTKLFLSQKIDAQGNTITLQYDYNGTNGGVRLLSITDALGQVTRLSYNLPGDRLKITQVTDPFGRSAVFQYDAQGRLISSRDVIGMVSSFGYDANSVMNSLTTPYGTSTMTQVNTPAQRMAEVTNPLGQKERVEFDVENPNVSATETTVPSGMSAYNSALDQNNTYYWDRRAYGDAVAGGAAPGTAGSYAYAKVSHWMTGFQGLMPVTASEKKALENRVWYAYPGQTAAGLLPDGGIASPALTQRVLDGGATQSTSASYNASGLIAQSVDPLGRTTHYNYDPTNGIDLLQVTQTNGFGQDVLSTMTYNALHEPLTTTDASGQTATMTYNAQGQLLTRTVVVGGQNQVTTMVYDGNGYLQTVTGPVAGAVTTYAYDSVGRVHTVTDSEGYVVTSAYDNLDRPTITTYPDGTTDQTVYQYLDVVKQIDRQGRATTRQYDAIRQLSQTTDPLGRTTKYTWCTCGGLSTLTDASNNVTTWSLDTQGRVTAKIYADTTHINYVYEAGESRLHQMTDARGNVAVYTYNVDNTLASTAYTPASGVSATPNVSFTYDTVYNRVTGMTDGTGTTNYAYNPITGSVTTGAGRLASVTVPIAGSTATVAYGYDELGRVTSRSVDQTTTNANNVSTTFDTLGRVTNATNPLGAFTYAYVNTTSRLLSVTYPSGTGLSTSYAYFNNVGDQRLQEIKNLKGAAIMSDFQYTYNAVGTIATWQQQTDSNVPTQYALGYDKADQLCSAVQTNTSTHATVTSNGYNYDPAGNRLAETTLTGTTTGRFNNLNQLTAYTGSTTTQTVSGHVVVPATVTVNAVPATMTNGTNFSAFVPLPNGTNVLNVVAQDTGGNTTTQRFSTVTSGTAPPALSYDANGNTLTDENGNTYLWDALNRLTAIIYSSGTNAGNHTEFACDGLSRRTQIVERTGTTVGAGTITSTKNYLWIGQEIAEERDASNNVTKRFLPQGEQQAGTNYYYTRDHLGSVREMCSSTGTITSRMSYDCMGRPTTVSGTVLPTKQYAGYYQHQTSGLELTWFRAYDPTVGRWLSRDPVSERQGTNIYEYVGNDPLRYQDAFGLWCTSWVPIWVSTNISVLSQKTHYSKWQFTGSNSENFVEEEGGVPFVFQLECNYKRLKSTQTVYLWLADTSWVRFCTCNNIDFTTQMKTTHHARTSTEDTKESETEEWSHVSFMTAQIFPSAACIGHMNEMNSHE